MSIKTRIYLIRSTGGNDEALIRAATRSQALAHFARRQFVATLPSQDDLLEAVTGGISVVDAAPDLDEAA